MTPAQKPAKMEAIKTQNGRIHVAMGLGPKTKPLAFKPAVAISWGLTEREPARCLICDLRIPECECIHSVEELARKFGLTQ